MKDGKVGACSVVCSGQLKNTIEDLNFMEEGPEHRIVWGKTKGQEEAVPQGHRKTSSATTLQNPVGHCLRLRRFGDTTQ